MAIQAIIFDLDGVIVSTDRYHYRAWKAIADQESIEFDETINHRLRGVSRMESLEIILEKANREYSDQEKIKLANKKNELYVQMLEQLSHDDILDDAAKVLRELKAMGIKIAIGSSSKNAKKILEQVKLTSIFDAIADGTDIKLSKPHPDVFLVAAEKLGVEPEGCIVVEDAEAGIIAAKAANMTAIGIGEARNCVHTDYKIDHLSELIELLVTWS